MKRALLFSIVVLLVAPNALGQNAKQRREATYQSTLHAYSEDLKPGMTRKEVEDYLHAKSTPYVTMCCVDERSAMADLVRIGKEKHPWYCSEHVVYIAFQFVDEPFDGHHSSHRDSDKLKAVTIHHSLEGCL